MKLINILIITTLLFLVIGCESPTETITSADEYYPLKVGNKWYYSLDQSDITVFNEVKEIIGTTEINNNNYYVTVTYGLPPSSYSDTSYARTDKSKLFIGHKNNIDGNPSFKENLTADFSLNVGDTIKANDYDYFTVTKRYDNIIEINWRSGLWGWTKFQQGIGILESTASNAVIHRRVLVKSELNK